jgi:hypothetical protein
MEGTHMIEKPKFFKDVIDIFPEGDLDKAYNSLLDILDQKQTDSLGNVVDYEYIMSKFRDFHNNWNLKYGRQMAKGYLAKDAESSRKTIYHFLMAALYQRNFETIQVNVERDKYLFGNQNDKLYDEIKRAEDELLTK